MNEASPTAGGVQQCCLTQAHPLQSQRHSRSTGDVDVDASERTLGTPLHLLYRTKLTSCARHHELAQRLRFTLNTASLGFIGARVNNHPPEVQRLQQCSE